MQCILDNVCHRTDVISVGLQFYIYCDVNEGSHVRRKQLLMHLMLSKAIGER